MAKMRLDVDALQVETFGTAATASERGTVRARSVDPAEGDAAFLPVTDWKTCQGAECTARTLCHYSCLGECFAAEGAFALGTDGG